MHHTQFAHYRGLEGFANVDMEHASCATIYEDSCRRLGVKANKEILSHLPKLPGHADTLRELNAGCSYIGDKGLLALFSVVHASPSLARIRLSDNGLRNESVLKLLTIIERHPSVVSLDLKGNKYLSLEIGTRCLRLVKANENFMHLSLSRTSVSKSLQNQIDTQLTKNRRANGERNRKALEGRVRIERAALFEAKELFDSFDKDKSGYVTMEEMAKIEEHLSNEKSTAFEVGLFKDFDKDGDRAVTLMEFLATCFPTTPVDDIMYWLDCYSEFTLADYMPPPELSPENLREIKEIFERYDTSKDGALSLGELKASLGKSAMCMDVEEYFHEADTSGDGSIDLKEFISLMRPFYVGDTG